MIPACAQSDNVLNKNLDQQLQYLGNEVDLLQQLVHNNIVQVLAEIAPAPGQKAIQGYLMPLAQGGTMKELIKRASE